MSAVVIGGEPYNIPPLTFFAVETAWPHFTAAQDESDPLVATGHFVCFLAAVLSSEYPQFSDPTALKKALLVREMTNVGAAVRSILVDNEMIPSGEAPAVVAAPAPTAASPEIAPPSFVNLSPQA